MWIEEDGTFGTAAPSDPAVVLGIRVVQVVKKMTTKERRQLTAWRDEAEDELLEWLGEGNVRLPAVGDISPWPEKPLLGSAETFDELVVCYNETPIEWRLDVLLALDDVLG